MEREPSSSVTMTAEGQSASVLFTYFQGDINSMVDEHFTRALSKASKPRGESSRTKRNKRSVKHEAPSPSLWDSHSTNWFESALPPAGTRLGDGLQSDATVSLSLPGESATLWSSSHRQAGGLGLPPMVYPSTVPPDGLAMVERQYTHSLLSLLHSDRPELSTVMVASSKPDDMPTWTTHPSYREQMSPNTSQDSDNEQFLVNTNCPIILVLEYMRAKLGLPESELLDLCDEKGVLKLLFQSQHPQDRADQLLLPRDSYLACSINCSPVDGAYVSTTVHVANPEHTLRETLKAQTEILEKARLEHLRMLKDLRVMPGETPTQPRPAKGKGRPGHLEAPDGDPQRRNASRRRN